MRDVLPVLIALLVITVAGQAAQDVWVYPCELIETYKPDCDCWHGIDEEGVFGDDIYVIPETLLIGAPPSDLSAVTVTTDHWIELGYPGPIVDGPGTDILVREMGQEGESALILLGNGQGRTYPIGIATALDTGGRHASLCEFDLQGLDPGFVPTAVRIVSLGLGGGSPGFDVASVQVRIETDPTRPHRPKPCKGAKNVLPDAPLQWQNTLSNDQIRLFVGQDPALLNDPNHPFTILPGDANSFTPSSHWTLGQTYYWRVASIDNSDANHPVLSDLWQFTVADSILLEDFESYQGTNIPYTDWYPVNVILYVTACSQGEPVYAGCQSAYAEYYTPRNSESYFHLDFETDQDWTQADPTHLAFVFRERKDFGSGTPYRLYCWLSDHNHQAPVYAVNDPNKLNDGQWHEVRIALSEFVGVDLTQIRQIGIGIEWTDPTGPLVQFGSLYIDDIRLRRGPTSMALESDLNRDNRLTYADLGLFTEAWLRDDHSLLHVSEPNDPLCRFAFDGDLNDTMNRIQASPNGVTTYSDGFLGQAVLFNDLDAAIHLRDQDIADVIRDLQTGITIAFWQFGTDSRHRNDTLICSDFVYGQREPQLAISLGLWHEPERLHWLCGSPWSPANRLDSLHQIRHEWTGRWNHWAFSKDFRTGVMTVYLNGRRHSRHQGLPGALSPDMTLTLGSGWYGHYDGRLDEFRLYDYALSEAEVAYLAGRGTGQPPTPVLLPWDFNRDGQVNLLDLAVLSRQWALAHGLE